MRSHVHRSTKLQETSECSAGNRLPCRANRGDRTCLCARSRQPASSSLFDLHSRAFVKFGMCRIDTAFRDSTLQRWRQYRIDACARYNRPASRPSAGTPNSALSNTGAFGPCSIRVIGDHVSWIHQISGHLTSTAGMSVRVVKNHVQAKINLSACVNFSIDGNAECTGLVSGSCRPAANAHGDEERL